MSESEQELVKRFKEGDKTAFWAFMESYMPLIYRRCLLMVDNAEDAEDLTQEVLIRVWESLPRYQGTAGFGTWLFAIVHNVCIDFSRRQQRRMAEVSLRFSEDLEDEDLGLVIPSTEPSPEEVLLRQELAQVIRSAIDELPERHREVFLLYYMGENTVKEIAETLGISLPAVGEYLHQSKKILRKTLSPYFEGEKKPEREPTFTRIPNPYIAGNPVLPESGMFVGRQQVFRFVEENLLGLRQKVTVVLHGQRRMGKSSILRNLGEYLSSDFIPVYVDMQRAAAVESTGGLLYNFAEAIWQELRHRRFKLAEPQLSDYAAEPFIVFSKFLDTAERKIKAPQKRFVLSLDEFEQIEAKIEEGTVRADLLGYLRNVMQHREGVVLIFAGTHTLEEMIRDYWSVFFGSTRSIKVSYLDELDALRLIRHPIDPIGLFPLTYDPGAAERIVEATHCQPYLVQLVCFELVNLKNQQRSNRASMRDVEVALERALRAGDYYFEGLWQLAGEEGQALLSDLAPAREATFTELAGRLQTPVEHVQAVFERLNRLDLLEGGADGQAGEPVHFQVELLRQWVERHVPRSCSTPPANSTTRP